MSSREQILKKLRKAQQPFTDIKPIENRRHVVSMKDTSPENLLSRFIEEADKLGCYIYQLDAESAFDKILELMRDDTSILSWDDEYIPLANLHDLLGKAGKAIAHHKDGNVRVGVTGVSYALSATGSLVLQSGAGRYRTASLLPDVHIAVLTPDQIMIDIETWADLQKTKGFPAFTDSSNTTIVTGPSKTADIAQELIKGAHGPREVHIMILQ